MVDGGEVIIEVLLVLLIGRMTCSAVGGRKSHPLISFYASRCAVTMDWSASLFCNLVVMSLKTLVRTVLSCGAVLAGAGMFFSDHRQNHMGAYFSTRRDNGAAMTSGDFTATA